MERPPGRRGRRRRRPRAGSRPAGTGGRAWAPMLPRRQIQLTSPPAKVNARRSARSRRVVSVIIITLAHAGSRRALSTVRLRVGGFLFLRPLFRQRRHRECEDRVIGGDGIGPEVVAEALKVVAATGVKLDTVDYDLGGARYLRDGTILPDSVLDEWRGLDALLLHGAVGTPRCRRVSSSAACCSRCASTSTSTSPAALPRRRAGHRHGGHPKAEEAYVGEGGVLRRGTPTRWPPRARSTPAWASSAACATPSTWPRRAAASTSRWSTRPTC